MPTTLLGLIIFAVLLAPGLVYVSVREFARERTRPDHSAFRETGQVALVSIACDLFVVGCFALVRHFLWSRTFDVGALVRDPNGYATLHYQSAAAWAIGLISAACSVAALFAWKLPPSERLAFHSAWWALFEEYRPKASVALVSCVLEDGSWIQGQLYSYSRDDSDTPDREFTLAAPLRYRAPGGDVEDLDDHAISLSARRLLSVSVTYTTEEAASKRLNDKLPNEADAIDAHQTGSSAGMDNDSSRSGGRD